MIFNTDCFYCFTDPDSCTLQSFTRKIKDVHTLPRSTHPSRDLSPSERESYARVQRGHKSSMDVNSPNKIKVNIEHANNGTVRNNGGSFDTRSRRQLQRPVLSGSQSDQLKKRHLPSIFINETENGSLPRRLHTRSKDGVVMVRAMSETESGSLHSMYYVSSDYHPDCLNTDSLPRNSELAKSSNGPQTVTDGRIHLERYNSNSLPRMYGETATAIPMTRSYGSIPRKKPPKMGLRSNSGSSSSLYQTHTRSSSGNVYILGHSRSASGTIFKTSDMTIPYINEIQLGRGRVVPRQSSQQSESEGMAGQYCESDIDNVLESSSMRSVDIHGISKPVEIHSVTFIERPHSPHNHSHTSPLRRTDRIFLNYRDKDQLSDENDSGCMANCADDNFESNYCTKKPSHSPQKTTPRFADTELDGFTTSELLSSKPFSLLSSIDSRKEKTKKFRSPWLNHGIEETGLNILDRAKSVEYAFFNNHYTTSSEDTDVTPSPRFDENTDRGFEEALNASYNSRESLCSCNGAYVESVSECTDMGDFFDTHQCDDKNEFKTQAVVSQVSPASFNDPFAESEESTFAKSKEIRNLHESKNSVESNPWPTSNKNSTGVDLSFETNFSSEREIPEGCRPYQDIEAVYF